MSATSNDQSITARLCTSLLLTVITLICGCVDTKRINKIALHSHTVKRFEEAASIHVAVLSSTPFERVRSELQPKFEMDENKALEEVIPNTQLLMERTLDVVERSLRLATPQTSTTSTVKTHSATGEASTRTSDSEESTTSGALPGNSGFPNVDRSAGALNAGTPAPPADRAVDPFSKYKAATALLQEIQLLNQYVVANEVPKDSSARVVRLQISVLPYARDQPYDVYTNISFFPTKTQTSSMPASLVSYDDGTTNENGSGKGVARVIPLLATDNFEASTQSSATEAVQQAALSLLALVKGFGLGTDYGRMLDQIRAVTGRELNALITTARLTDNTLRVRLGAPLNNGAGYAMVPQTYNVAAVVFVPKGVDRVDVVARSTLRNATSGAALDYQDRATVARVACERLGRYPDLPGNPLRGNTEVEWYKPEKFCASLQPESGPEDCNTTSNMRSKILCLEADVEFGRFNSFRDRLTCTASAWSRACASVSSQPDYSGPVTALWAGFAEELASNRYSRTWFNVEPTKRLWPAEQTVLAMDDGQTLTMTLTSGQDLPTRGISASIVLPVEAPKAKANSSVQRETLLRKFTATSVEVQNRTNLQLVFPSPQLMSQSADLSKLATLTLAYLEDDGLFESPAATQSMSTPRAFDVIVRTKAPEHKPQPALAFSVSGISVDEKGTASVRLEVRNTDLEAKNSAGDLYLKVSGGDLVQHSPESALIQTSKGLRFKRAVPIDLTFRNVRETVDMVFTLLGKDAKSKLDEVRLDVWSLATPKPNVKANGG